MAIMTIASVSGRTYPMPQLESRHIDFPKAAIQQEAEQHFKIASEGMKLKGREMYEKAYQNLDKLLGRTEVTATRTVDTDTGATQVILTSDTTGKVIKKLPADGVMEMVRRAKASATGWIINTIA